MYCKNCNKSLPDNMRFCDTCGAPLEAENTQPQPQPQYQSQPQPPVYNAQPGYIEQEQPVSVGEFLGAMLLQFIPCVGWLIFLIMMFVWAFGSSVKPSKRNWAKANLIFALISAGVFIIIWIIIGNIGYNIIDNYRYYNPYNF